MAVNTQNEYGMTQMTNLVECAAASPVSIYRSIHEQLTKIVRRLSPTATTTTYRNMIIV